MAEGAIVPLKQVPEKKQKAGSIGRKPDSEQDEVPRLVSNPVMVSSRRPSRKRVSIAQNEVSMSASATEGSDSLGKASKLLFESTGPKAGALLPTGSRRTLPDLASVRSNRSSTSKHQEAPRSASVRDASMTGQNSTRSIQPPLPSEIADVIKGITASAALNSLMQYSSGAAKSVSLSPKPDHIMPEVASVSHKAESTPEGLIIDPSDASRKLMKASPSQAQNGSHRSLVSQQSVRSKASSKALQSKWQVPSRSADRIDLLSSRGSNVPRSIGGSTTGKSVSELVLATHSISVSTTTNSRKSTTLTRLDQSCLSTKLDDLMHVNSKTELDLRTRMDLCPCPDVGDEDENENEEAEMKRFLESFGSDTRSKHSSIPYHRTIRTVERSPFERKDRAARQEFLKELENMEIAEIEKKQKLKPRKLKKYLKKEGVYQTIKAANFIPDSQTSSSRGHPSRESIDTFAEGEYPVPSSSSSAASVVSSDGSKDRIDRFQLRKDQSLGSRATTAQPLQREEAFLEIELSEADDVDPTPRSSLSLSTSSETEVLTSSSEISLRVNLEKTHLPADRQKIKARNVPYLTYKNKVKAEIDAAANKDSHEGSTQENLIIDKIATEFGEWAKDNGLKPEAVEKDIIKELFQFGTMDTAANSIAVEIKELVIVPDTITEGEYPELEERAALYRHILWDEMAYWKKERSMAFGKPDPFPYKRPLHEPLPLWTKSGFVPLPLSTGELLYQSLIDNESLSYHPTEFDKTSYLDISIPEGPF